MRVVRQEEPDGQRDWQAHAPADDVHPAPARHTEVSIQALVDASLEEAGSCLTEKARNVPYGHTPWGRVSMMVCDAGHRAVDLLCKLRLRVPRSKQEDYDGGEGTLEKPDHEPESVHLVACLGRSLRESVVLF